MARTPSNMLPLGTKAPDFNILDTVSDKLKSLNQLEGDTGTLVAFICNHCPFVIHINATLVKLANDYQKKGINFIAISSNDVKHYPQDGPDLMKVHANKLNYAFPYLYDETQNVAKAYDAACTPDFFLFDKDRSLVYRGQMDDSRPGNGIVNDGQDLKHAMNCLIENKVNNRLQKPSIGCNIKWK
ncbi:MAG: thioredoxin family protein [Flavobacteriaceae bacterium]|nr:thioredoxin family protein [Flavobacteriaceae bacterium]